ncbi:NADH-ubiquinone oxidoreductase chain E (EC [Olavius algarvensis associated proteobacterium Delta 3]|nr:NADH-ubiquinone oxidoreductase chain E (EC [Olavius algarvensis associated proteobacterium Delta 3]CAB5128772.1 NADH-ubiquinone oxidoreductase chain E (EC [Olavius algarvensis associated proteobacterium Delta 3]
MLPEELQDKLEHDIAAVDHPKELAVDVMFALQDHYGYLTDEAVETAAGLLGIAPVEIEELATFYTFVYREPVGKYVIHVCDSLLCMLDGSETIEAHLHQKLGIGAGETTGDDLFTLLPVCCIGYCDRAPAILINRKVYGPLTVESLDAIIDRLRADKD